MVAGKPLYALFAALSDGERERMPGGGPPPRAIPHWVVVRRLEPPLPNWRQTFYMHLLHALERQGLEREAQVDLQGWGAHLEPSGSWRKSELVMNERSRYVGSCTSVVTSNHFPPVGSWKLK